MPGLKYSSLVAYLQDTPLTYKRILLGAADCRAKRTSVPYSADSLRHN